MSVLPPTLAEALEADASLWPGPLSNDARARFGEVWAKVPDDAKDVLASALVDPERNPWARASLLALEGVAGAGGRVVAMHTDEVFEAVDLRGDRFGIHPIGFRLPSHPSGDPGDVRRLTSALDLAFGQRRYVLWMRRPVPDGLPVEPIRKAVQLWLAALDRGERVESHAVYEDDDVALDLTVLADGMPAGRMLTVPPLGALERLAEVDNQIVDAASRSEESVGDLPLMVALAADAPWCVSRGYLQQLLYGTPDQINTDTDGQKHAYEAMFTANGRSLFSDPACRSVAALWWFEPGAALLPGPLMALENPWSAHLPALGPECARFVSIGPGGRRATLRWEGR